MKLNLQSISVLCESLIRIALQTFEGSQVHDMSVCCIYLFMNSSIGSLFVPECLKMDQLHRGYMFVNVRRRSSIITKCIENEYRIGPSAITKCSQFGIGPDFAVKLSQIDCIDTLRK